MEYIKNISGATLTLAPLGIIMNTDEQRDISEIGNRARIQDHSTYLNDLIYDDKISLLDANGNAFRKGQAVQYFSNAFHSVIIDNENTKNYNYYFVKDIFDIKKNSATIKFFAGRVKTLSVYPSDNDIEVRIITGDGISMPKEKLLKRQTLEFDFYSDVRDMIIIFYADKPVEVEVFIDGYNTDKNLIDLQNFIWTWDENTANWETQSPVLVQKKNNKNVDIVKDGNTVIVDDVSSNYHLYKITNDYYFLEHVTNGKWNNLSSNRVSCIIKNSTHVQFTNQTKNLSTVTRDMEDYIGDEE